MDLINRVSYITVILLITFLRLIWSLLDKLNDVECNDNQPVSTYYGPKPPNT